MAASDLIKDYFTSSGYKELPVSKSPKTLLWQPDFILSKNGYIYLVLVKSNNSIPPAFLDRINKIPSRNIIPLIIFAQKLSITNENIITSAGISIGYFIRGKVLNLKIKKKLPKQEIQKEIKKKLEVIDIFISSKQDIAEREFILDRLEVLRKTNSFPFNPPHLIEYDRFVLNKLYEHIKQVMRNCEWIVIILEDNFSKVVRYEIKQAVKLIRHENIFMFVKSSSSCQTKWKTDLNNIKELKTIKYLPYTDTKDLEVSLARAINKRMTEIQKKKKIQIFIQ